MGVLKARVAGAWVDVAADEVFIGASDPGMSYDLWYDSDATVSPSGEVYIGPDDPIAVAPTVELWYDSDAVGPTAYPIYGLESLKPASPTGPFRYFATDTKRDWLFDGTGWMIVSEPPVTTFVPTLSQGATGNISKSLGPCYYQRSNGRCLFNVRFFVTGAGTAGFAVESTIPIANGFEGGTYGTGFVFGPTFWEGTCQINSNKITWATDGGAGNAVGANPSFALANGHIIAAQVDYVMASRYT